MTSHSQKHVRSCATDIDEILAWVEELRSCVKPDLDLSHCVVMGITSFLHAKQITAVVSTVHSRTVWDYCSFGAFTRRHAGVLASVPIIKSKAVSVPWWPLDLRWLVSLTARCGGVSLYSSRWPYNCVRMSPSSNFETSSRLNRPIQENMFRLTVI